MPTLDTVLKNIGDNLRNLNTDVKELKTKVGRLITQDGGGHYLPFSNYGGLSAGLSLNQSVFLAGIPKQIVVRSWKQVWHMSSGDVSNYWVVGFHSQAGTHFAFTTQPANGPAATWNRYDHINLSTTLLESYRYVYIDVSKIGAPGPLYLGTPMVYFI